ncbi:hypothetical protein DPMN_154370, partial [Dreissena polymorpha]
MPCTVMMSKYDVNIFNIVFAQIPLADQLKCRLCNNALELRDCTKQAICDNRTEECYMEQVLTETFNTVYRGGCQSRD